MTDEQIVGILQEAERGEKKVADLYAGSGLCNRFCSKISVLAGLPMMP